jgi:acyl carrier protein
MIDRKTALDVVVHCLKETLAQSDGPAPAEITEETVIVGKDAVVDSAGVVSLIVDIEQRLEMEHDVLVTLANDKAMSQKNSPFRTAGVLADHICATIKEGQAA